MAATWRGCAQQIGRATGSSAINRNLKRSSFALRSIAVAQLLHSPNAAGVPGNAAVVRSCSHSTTAAATNASINQNPEQMHPEQQLDPPGPTQQQHQLQQQQQRRLDAAAIEQVVRSSSTLSELLGGCEGLVVEELLDGVINLVYAVHGPSGGSAIIKQALPYVRAVGESFPLSRDRMEVEAAAMQLLHSCCPTHVPALLLYDPGNSVLAMQYLPPPHQKLLYAIRQGQVLSGLSGQLAELLATYLAHSSLELLQPDDAAAVVSRFANSDIVAANEQVVLLAPFNPQDPTNRRTSPQLDEQVQAMWHDAGTQSSAAAMLQLYRNQKQALIHNDLHAGNLLVAPGSLFLIDWEFATTGPLAFDTGCFMGNLILAVLALQGMEQTEQQQQGPDKQQQQQQGPDRQQQQQSNGPSEGHCYSRQQQAEWLLQVLEEFWCGFMQQYPVQLAAARAAASNGSAGLYAAVLGAAGAQQTDCSSSCSAVGSAVDGRKQQQSGPLQETAAAVAGAVLQQHFQAAGQDTTTAGPAGAMDELQWQQLLLDSCGFAGCCLIRLTVGLHHYPDIHSIPDATTRAAVEGRCLQLGQQLLRLRAEGTARIAEQQVRSSRSSGGTADISSSTTSRDGGSAGAASIQQVVAMVRAVCDGWFSSH